MGPLHRPRIEDITTDIPRVFGEKIFRQNPHSPPMDSEPATTKSERYKCSACYKQYKTKEHLIEHMRVSYHSVHQPKCPVCKKYCKTLESVREHLRGPLAKPNCAAVFSTLGCDLCLAIFGNVDVLGLHKTSCSLLPSPASELITSTLPQVFDDSKAKSLSSAVANNTENGPKLVAMDCEMVGGGSDGTLNICASVCLINEDEDVIFHSYVKPIIPVTNYRSEVTGITEDYLVNAKPFNMVRERVEEILCNGEESAWRMRSDGGKACLLIGHSLEYDLTSLHMDHPENLIRDTAKYVPLMKTNLASHSLKYLTKSYLGYDIQTGLHNPYEDCVAAMRLYKRIRSQAHETEGDSVHCKSDATSYNKKSNPFELVRPDELLQKSSDDLLRMSGSAYKCWCLDTRRSANPDSGLSAD